MRSQSVETEPRVRPNGPRFSRCGITCTPHPPLIDLVQVDPPVADMLTHGCRARIRVNESSAELADLIGPDEQRP